MKITTIPIDEVAKLCPWCGKPPFHLIKPTNKVYCINPCCPSMKRDISFEDWQSRPIEDALRKQLEVANGLLREICGILQGSIGGHGIRQDWMKEYRKYHVQSPGLVSQMSPKSETQRD
ncbi:MAG: hypothetical protein A2Y53_00045 [Chloroflexi bacterium RBG_16_47_49]|nr:MAG: hypothetical protein A2Y53_00045 [Chloroflexi bacterium RBG_16_47_49]